MYRVPVCTEELKTHNTMKDSHEASQRVGGLGVALQTLRDCRGLTVEGVRVGVLVGVGVGGSPPLHVYHQQGDWLCDRPLYPHELRPCHCKRLSLLVLLAGRAGYWPTGWSEDPSVNPSSHPSITK